MTYFHSVIENQLRNTNHSVMLDIREFIDKKAEDALEEFESLRLSGLDVNTAHEITTHNLLENLNQLTN